MSKRKILKIAIFSILIICMGAIFFYVNDFYHAQDVSMYMQSSKQVKVISIDKGYLFDGYGEDALIFYPGGKVEETAYLPLAYKLAEKGIDCFLIKMPCKLAVFGINRAKEIMDDYSYNTWSMAGHSLGGAMAASYAYSNPEKIENVFLLGAYSTENLAEKGINTYFIYGSNDKILSQDKLEESKQLISNYDELVITGGNHSLFGDYGHQKGDGKEAISKEEQIDITVEKILNVCGVGEK